MLIARSPAVACCPGGICWLDRAFSRAILTRAILNFLAALLLALALLALALALAKSWCRVSLLLAPTVRRVLTLFTRDLCGRHCCVACTSFCMRLMWVPSISTAIVIIVLFELHGGHTALGFAVFLCVVQTIVAAEFAAFLFFLPPRATLSSVRRSALSFFSLSSL